MLERLREVWYRVRSLLRRESLGAELDEELQLHRELLAEEAVRRGATPDEARRLAAVRLGNAGVIRERSRDWWSLPRLESVVQDVRYALRFLRRSPGFTAVAVLSIALGVGANAAVFTIVDRVFLRPPAGVSGADRLRRVYVQTSGGTRPGYVRGSLSFAEFLAFDSGLRSIDGASVVGYPAKIRTGRGLDAPTARESPVSSNYFSLLGVRPEVGRLFLPEDDAPMPAALPVVVSYGYWQRALGGAPDVVGRQITVGGDQGVIVGVAARGFSGIEVDGADLWTPALATAPREGPNWRANRRAVRWNAIVRVRAGYSDAAAGSEIGTAISALPRPDIILPDQTLSAELASLIAARGPEVLDSGASVALRLAAAALLVLLAACANVANLFFMRTLARRREIAVRLAIGVSRGRLFAQLVTEALVVSVFGSAAALALARTVGGLLGGLLLPGVTWERGLVDGRVVGFTLGFALMSGIVAAVLPAARAARVDVGDSLKTGGSAERNRSGFLLRGSLLSLQLGMCLALLFGAGLFTTSLSHALHLDLGFDAEHLVYVMLTRTTVDGRATSDLPLLEGARDRLRAVAGVRDIGLAATVPFFSVSFSSISVPGHDDALLSDAQRPFVFPVDPEAMRAMGVRRVAGRLIDDGDIAGAPHVVVVSRRMARSVWGGEHALGQCVRMDSMPCSQVVGVVDDLISYRLTEDEPPQLFVPLAQAPTYFQPWALFVRVEGDVPARLAGIRAALRGWRTDLASLTVKSVRENLDPQFRPWRLGAVVFSLFGLIALALAGIGVYGLVAFNVAQRSGELGVRAALGATRGRLARLVLGDTVRLAVAGVGVGAGVSLAASRLLAALLFETSARDPLLLSAASLALLLIAVAAAIGPMRRAVRADPVTALRAE